MPAGFLPFLWVTVWVPPGRAALASSQSHAHPPSWTAALGCGEDQVCKSFYKVKRGPGPAGILLGLFTTSTSSSVRPSGMSGKLGKPFQGGSLS